MYAYILYNIKMFKKLKQKYFWGSKANGQEDLGKKGFKWFADTLHFVHTITDIF